MSERLSGNYDAFARVETAFHAELEKSLDPRGPELLYELVAELDLPPRAFVVDAGCGEGHQSKRLAELGYDVLGVDPMARHVELARENAPEAQIELGSIESLPVADATVDLVWFRDALVLVPSLDAAFGEVARVLRPGGHMLLYSMFATDRLEPGAAAWMWHLEVIPSSTNTRLVEAAIERAGLRTDRRVTIGSDWGEFAEEESGKPGKRLLWAARLMRKPDRYIERFGRTNYEIMLADCLWHVYAMIGKLERRAYVLTKP